jgi:F420-dependent oxidoreductase-like protein
MDVGVIVPQGWTGEYDGWDAGDAWARTLELADAAEDLGFESIWLFDHMHTTPDPTEEITFESFTALGALAERTTRVRLGHLVSCAGYRNPALAAKMITTLDVISGGRMDFAIGAGWKKDEWLAYGYGFPSLRERQTRLRDALEIATRMLRSKRATYTGETASIDDAINVPQPVQQPTVPIIVGGNGRDVTWRLAAQYADELNLDNVPPDEMPDAMRVIRERCEEIGRDPATLRVSVHIWWEALEAGDPRPLLEHYREAGVARVMALVRSAARDDDALPAFRDAAIDAGATLARQPVRGAST